MLCASCGKQNTDPNLCSSCARSPFLEGQYQLDSIVGRGASGITYRAQRLSDRATVAVKELSFRSLDSFKALDLFQREAKVLKQLQHPGIPAYLGDFYVEEGKNISFYLVQEFISGDTLAKESEGRRYSEQEVLYLACEILEILSYLHSLSPALIHRDLKPQNIMRRSTNKKLVLIDFGCVKDSIQNSLQGGSTVAGTFGYMPPEQFQGKATPASDIYSLGAVLVSLLANTPADKLLNTQNQLEWSHRVKVRPEVHSILSKMLAPDPDERYSNAAALRREIENLLAQWERPAPRVNAPSGSSVPMLIALGGFVAVAGIGAAMFFTISGESPSTLLGLGKSAAKFQVAQDLAWFDRYTKPLAVDINKDGVEDLIAIYAKPDNQGYVGAFDGKDFKELWSAGPFGESKAASGKLKAALAGERLLITDFQGNASLYELSTGALVKSFPQEDVVGALCGAPPGESIVWIDPPGLLINGADATTSSGQPPERCREYSSYDSNQIGLEWHNFRGSSAKEKPKFPKFDVASTFEDAGKTYALVKEKTGYQQHYLLRYEDAEIKESIAIQPFAPDAKELLLQLVSHRFGGSFIQDGRFLFFYEEKSDRFYPTYHAVSVDLATKQKVFDLKIDFSTLIPSSQNTITKDRLYIVDEPRLHIFDAKTGEYIAIFGK